MNFKYNQINFKHIHVAFKNPLTISFIFRINTALRNFAHLFSKLHFRFCNLRIYVFFFQMLISNFQKQKKINCIILYFSTFSLYYLLLSFCQIVFAQHINIISKKCLCVKSDEIPVTLQHRVCACISYRNHTSRKTTVSLKNRCLSSRSVL